MFSVITFSGFTVTFKSFFPPLYIFFRLDEAAVKVEEGRRMQHHMPWDMESAACSGGNTAVTALVSPAISLAGTGCCATCAGFVWGRVNFLHSI